MTQAGFTFRTMSHADIAPLQALAGRIWRAHYPGIISHEQIEYMLEKLYATEVLAAQVHAGRSFWLAFHDAEMAGFLSVAPLEETAEPGAYFLHKFYVDPVWHGKGVARALFALATGHCADARSFTLRVNRRNIRAINAYIALGFRIAEERDTEFGGGFIMEDFVMRKEVSL